MEKTASLKKGRMTTVQMTVTALMTAVLCIFGPMALPIPVSPVPISLTNLVLYFWQGPRADTFWALFS